MFGKKPQKPGHPVQPESAHPIQPESKEKLGELEKFPSKVVVLRKLEGTLFQGWCAEFSPAGFLAIKGTTDKRKEIIQIFDPTGTLINSCEDRVSDVTEFCWMGDQHLLMMRKNSPALSQFDIKAKKGSKTTDLMSCDFSKIEGKPSAVIFLSPFPNRQVVTVFYTGELMLWDLNTKQNRMLTKLKSPHSVVKLNDTQVVCLSDSPKMDKDMDVSLFDMKKEQTVWQQIFEGVSSAECVATVLDKSRVAIKGKGDLPIIDFENNKTFQAGRGAGFNHICGLPENFYLTIELNYDRHSVPNEANCRYVLYAFDPQSEANGRSLLYALDPQSEKALARIPIPDINHYSQILFNPATMHIMINSNGTLYDLDIGLKGFFDNIEYRKNVREVVEDKVGKILNPPLANITLQYLDLKADKTRTVNPVEEDVETHKQRPTGKNRS